MEEVQWDDPARIKEADSVVAQKVTQGEHKVTCRGACKWRLQAGPARFIDTMEEQGIVGPAKALDQRDVLIDSMDGISGQRILSQSEKNRNVMNLT